jgi:hypothetical protein
MSEAVESRKCPECGKGDLVEITYREGSPSDVDEDIQTADTRQVVTYSCGHEIVGPSLARSAAGTDQLEAERRESEETVEPPPTQPEPG